MRKGLLVVISGPSGVGKGTVIRQLLKKDESICLSVSCTTRPPRPGEIDGVHYAFVTKEKFLEMIEAGEFLEYMPVFANYYGTPLKMVQEKREQGKDVILEIDVKGALAVKQKVRDAVMIFIMPPSKEELKRRLVGRGTESEDQLSRRVAEAEVEMEKNVEYDHIVVNRQVSQAVKEIQQIIDKEHREREGK